MLLCILDPDTWPGDGMLIRSLRERGARVQIEVIRACVRDRNASPEPKQAHVLEPVSFARSPHLRGKQTNDQIPSLEIAAGQSRILSRIRGASASAQGPSVPTP